MIFVVSFMKVKVREFKVKVLLVVGVIDFGLMLLGGLLDLLVGMLVNYFGVGLVGVEVGVLLDGGDLLVVKLSFLIELDFFFLDGYFICFEIEVLVDFLFLLEEQCIEKYFDFWCWVELEECQLKLEQ